MTPTKISVTNTKYLDWSREKPFMWGNCSASTEDGSISVECFACYGLIVYGWKVKLVDLWSITSKF